MEIYTDIRNDQPFDEFGNKVEIEGKPTLYKKGDGEFIVFDSQAEKDAYMAANYPNNVTGEPEEV